ncbi:heterokaryon incompatibility protein-domain-containing protein [Halenospora varia]|nr:heterokaryon incompatibility protein-domain-containing protein [Halenospora varia]
MENTIFIQDPDYNLDSIIAHSQRRLLMFQLPRDIPSFGKLDPEDPQGFRLFQYEKLKHDQNIRLLGYPNTSDSNDITFHMDEKLLEDASGAFIAVSYYWGNEQPTEHLPLSPRLYLEVTRTVHSLLRHIAGVASGFPLWVDAICINQADLAEKSSQVGMMKDIYAAAKCVIVWLGNGNLTKNDELVLWSYLASLSDRNNSTPNGYRGFGGIGDTLCGQVLQSPWFERVWVVQEACFARTVFFLSGAIGMSLPFLSDYLEMRRENHENLPISYSIASDWGRDSLPAFNRFNILCNQRDQIQQNGGKPQLPLTDILLDFQTCKATDARDKVFALLGLAAYHNIQPDYTKSTSDAFTEAMIACSPSLYDYRLLGYAGLANPKPNGPTQFATVPTWVPNFSSAFLAQPFTLRADFKATPARDLAEVAFGSMSGKPQLLSRGIPRHLGLFIRAAFIDTVNELSMPGLCSVDSPFSDHEKVLQRQYDISSQGIEMLKRRNHYPVLASASVTCCEAMTAGDHHQDGSMSEEIKSAAFEAFRKSKGAAEFLSHSRENDKLGAYMHRTGIGRSRRLFITQNGYLGAANNGIMEGDRVCLIDGAPVPFILRGPVAKFRKYTIYNLVCDAFINGIMYREASNLHSIRFEMILLE